MSKQVWHETFIVVLDDEENVVNFKSIEGCDIYFIVGDIIKFLQHSELNKTYKLFIDDIKLSINCKSNVQEVVDKYYYKHVTMNL